MGTEGASESRNTAAVEDVAHLLVRCLRAEGVEHVFGIPGEENIRFVDALNDSGIRYILVRHEQTASFMAEIYGRLTGRAGVCSATLGPGAINLLPGTADAMTNSAPMVALAAQGSRCATCHSARACAGSMRRPTANVAKTTVVNTATCPHTNSAVPRRAPNSLAPSPARTSQPSRGGPTRTVANSRRPSAPVVPAFISSPARPWSGRARKAAMPSSARASPVYRAMPL
nr:thiamine pyrophosphate-binding protein [Streptomyces griseochromogenes]